MKIYLTTDTHFKHANIIEFCNRPVGYEELIFKGFNDLKEDDILIHLGDVAWGNVRDCHERYIKPLKCKKWLAKGNHDNKSYNWYLDDGWDFVAESFTLKYLGKTILFSHKLIDITSMDVDYNIHGRFHNLPKSLLKI